MNYYDILGVSKNSSLEEIKQSYKKLVIKNHPDKGGDKEKFQRIQEAYEVLSDENKRREYDNPNPFQQGGGFPGFPQGFPFQQGPFNFFNNTPKKNYDQTYNCKITLKDVYNGITKTFNIKRKSLCNSCKKKCDMCNGSGMINTGQQIHIGPIVQIIQRQCDMCVGVGVIKNTISCVNCNSSGYIHKEKTINLKIPKGVENGKEYIFEEWGEQSNTPNEKSGNFIIVINVENDNVFTRSGMDLHYETKINIYESIAGKKLSIPYFGETLNIDTSNFCVINPNKEYIVLEKGLVNENGTRGNLYIKFNIEYPERVLNEEESLLLNNIFKKLKLC